MYYKLGRLANNRILESKVSFRNFHSKIYYLILSIKNDIINMLKKVRNDI